MFLGNHPITMDTKGRLAVPTKWRELLMKGGNSRIIVTIDLYKQCLTAYPVNEWNDAMKECNKVSVMDRNRDPRSYLLIGHATECDMDGQGRLHISPVLRELADLKKRVRIVGQGDIFSLWDESRWIEHSNELIAQIRDEESIAQNHHKSSNYSVKAIPTLAGNRRFSHRSPCAHHISSKVSH